MVFKDPLTAQTRGIHTISNYEQMDLGRAGELRVNEYNQELLLTREELSLAGDNLPVRLQRIYHSYPTGQNSVGAYGVQWSINYSVRLRYDTAGGFFVYDRDATGAGTVFQKTKWVSGDWVCWRGDLGDRPTLSVMASERVNRRVTSQNENDPRNLSKL